MEKSSLLGRSVQALASGLQKFRCEDDLNEEDHDTYSDALDEDDVAQQRGQHVARLALAWPLGDVELCSKPAFDMELIKMFDATGPNIEANMAACFGVLLAQASGQEETAGALAVSWQKVFGCLMSDNYQNMHPTKIEEQELHARRLASACQITKPSGLGVPMGTADLTVRMAQTSGEKHGA